MYSDVYGKLTICTDGGGGRGGEGGFRATAAAAAALPLVLSSSSSSYNLYPSSSVQEVINGVHVEMGTLDRAAVASRNHREAEKRRREKIKSHLDRLRNILACDPKLDKATLLEKAVAHVRDLKHQTSQISNVDHLPTETDSVLVRRQISTMKNSHSILKASFCCDDRPSLLPDLIETLRSLKLRTVKAEIATVGGRLRVVLVVVKEREEDEEELDEEEEEMLREALKGVVEREVRRGGGCCDDGGDRMKRRKMMEGEGVIYHNQS